jgi:phage gpG-like protein
LRRRWHGKKKSLGTRILQNTGMLKNSIGTDIRGHEEIAIGPSARYGKFHQLGTSHVPQRPFLLFQEEDIARIMKIISDTLAENPGN